MWLFRLERTQWLTYTQHVGVRLFVCILSHTVGCGVAEGCSVEIMGPHYRPSCQESNCHGDQ